LRIGELLKFESRKRRSHGRKNPCSPINEKENFTIRFTRKKRLKEKGETKSPSGGLL